MPTQEDLTYLQSLPLELKIGVSEMRLREFLAHYEGYVCFSGGKDSTVLLHLVRRLYPDTEALFINTGLEYPEIQQFVNKFDNVTTVRPKKRFDEVLKKYGYPMISKEISNTIYWARKNIKDGKVTDRTKKMTGDTAKKNGKTRYDYRKYAPLLDADFLVSDICCNVMKKYPSHLFSKKTGKYPIMGTMADESMLRKTEWFQHGCNIFEGEKISCKPLSFWTEQDILQYIKENNLEIASVYGEIVAETNKQTNKQTYRTTGCHRTGCIFCAYGCHLEKSPSRFESLKETHPKQYAYCLNGGEHDENGLWIPSKDGLGMKHVFDEMNKIYGEKFIKY